MDTQKIRSKRKLLQVLKFHFDTLEFSGMCHCIVFLKKNSHISNTEYHILDSLIYREIKESSLFNRVFYPVITKAKNHKYYFWAPYYKLPRLRYIDYLLKKYKNE